MTYNIALNKENIKKILGDFHTLTNIRIAFYNHHNKEYLAYPRDVCLFCETIRKNTIINDKCMECDGFAFKQAEQTGKMYLYECHAGLYEAVAPIILDGHLLGYLMIGQVLSHKPTDEGWSAFCKRFKYYNLDLDNLRSAYFHLNSLTVEKLSAAARMMDTNAKYIYLSKVIKIQHMPIVHRINHYIDNHITETVTVSQISIGLSVSKSYLNQLIQKEYGMSIGNYILHQKMEKAKLLLEQDDETICEIGKRIGIADQNYFSRIFKKVVGMPPKQYRQTLK